MKTRFTSGLITLVFALFMLSATSSKAQCPQDWFVQNNLSCNITIDVIMVDFTGTCPALIPGNSCNTLTGIVIPPGQNYTLGCGSCTNVCDIMITITDIGGTTTSDVATFTLSASPSLCGASSFSYDNIDTFTVQ